MVMEGKDLGMSEISVQAIADEIADDIWTLVDGIRAEAGVPMTRQDEVRILNIRRKLTRRLVLAIEHQGHAESAIPNEFSDPKEPMRGRQGRDRLRYSHRASTEGQHT